MPLTCGCDFEPEPGDWMYFRPDDYSTLATSRRKRCSSCNDLIDIGATVATFNRVKIAYTEVEINIYGEDGEVPLAPMHLCECCADLYFSLSELGFDCVGPDENMKELTKEYGEVYGPPIPQTANA